MPYRPTSENRKNIRGVIYPLTEAVLRVYGNREQDRGRPIGAFYTLNVDNRLWQHLGGIWYRPITEARLLLREINEDVARAFAASILNGEPVTLPSGRLVNWERIPRNEASQLPPPIKRASEA